MDESQLVLRQWPSSSPRSCFQSVACRRLRCEDALVTSEGSAPVHLVCNALTLKTHLSMCRAIQLASLTNI